MLVKKINGNYWEVFNYWYRVLVNDEKTIRNEMAVPSGYFDKAGNDLKVFVELDDAIFGKDMENLAEEG